MSEPILKEIEKLSLWDLSHYWHGFNPQKSTPSRLPLEVQKTMRALALKASKGLYLHCAANGFIHNRLTDPEDQITITLVKRIYRREFNFVIKGKKYKRQFLTNISMGRKGVLIWCKKNKIAPPKFWFGDDDPLLNKTIEELDTSLPPEQMKKYGYIPLFEIGEENQSLNSGFQFSSDVDNHADRPDFKKKHTIIQEAISESNRANAKARYTKLDEIKTSFMKFYEAKSQKTQSKSELIRQFFDTLSFAEKVLIVPTYDENDKKEGYKKAVRNLLKVIKI